MNFCSDVRSNKVNYNFYNNPWRYPLTRKLTIQKKIDFVIKNCKKNQKVVDIGCGLGTLTFELARKGIHVDAIDISQKSLQFAKNTAKKCLSKKEIFFINFKKVKVEDYLKNLEKNSLDRAIFFRTLHHIPNPDKLFRQIKNKLRKNGKIIIVEPFRSSVTYFTGIFAFLIRLLSPTWLNNNKKFNFKKISDIEKSIKIILDEYKYISKKRGYDQSPMDNITSDQVKVIKLIRNNFDLETIEEEDSFKDKILGGIRGKDKTKIIKFLYLFDEFLIKKNILKGTSYKIIARKR